jgi:4'-phosphopantetheinyl transferase
MDGPAAAILTVAGGVHVALARLDRVLGGGIVPTAQDLAAVDGQRPRRARRRLGARLALRVLLGAVAGPVAAAAPLASRPGGRPYLPDLPELSVSLSHTDGWVAAAVATGRAVGVDVQVPRPVSAALLRHCCAGRTRGLLADLPDRERSEEFAWIWTVREACKKASGAEATPRPIVVAAGEREGSWGGYRWRRLHGWSPTPVSCAYGEPR